MAQRWRTTTHTCIRIGNWILGRFIVSGDAAQRVLDCILRFARFPRTELGLLNGGFRLAAAIQWRMFRAIREFNIRMAGGSAAESAAVECGGSGRSKCRRGRAVV